MRVFLTSLKKKKKKKEILESLQNCRCCFNLKENEEGNKKNYCGKTKEKLFKTENQLMHALNKTFKRYIDKQQNRVKLT